MTVNNSNLDESVFKAENIFVENSEIKEKSFLYKDCRITDSYIGGNCIVGDFARITNSMIEAFNRIDRSTLIYFSKVGAYSSFGNTDMIMHSHIGKFCSISWGVTIGAANHNYNMISTHDFFYNDAYGIKPKGEAPAYDRYKNKTTVGNDVWIGANCTIANGVKIGNGAVVGANSIVTKDVPPYAIVAGTPAKIIKYRFDDDVIRLLNDLEWWNLPVNILKENYSLLKSDNVKQIIDELRKIKNSL